jgi:putative transposase
LLLLKKSILDWIRLHNPFLFKRLILALLAALYLAVSFEDGVENQTYTSQQTAGVDLGEIHTLYEESRRNRSKMRSIHRLLNKKLAEIGRLQSKCRKGSRQWKKYQRVKRISS